MPMSKTSSSVGDFQENQSYSKTLKDIKRKANYNNSQLHTRGGDNSAHNFKCLINKMVSENCINDFQKAEKKGSRERTHTKCFRNPEMAETRIT